MWKEKRIEDDFRLGTGHWHGSCGPMVLGRSLALSPTEARTLLAAYPCWHWMFPLSKTALIRCPRCTWKISMQQINDATNSCQSETVSTKQFVSEIRSFFFAISLHPLSDWLQVTCPNFFPSTQTIVLINLLTHQIIKDLKISNLLGSHHGKQHKYPHARHRHSIAGHSLRRPLWSLRLGQTRGSAPAGLCRCDGNNLWHQHLICCHEATFYLQGCTG